MLTTSTTATTTATGEQSSTNVYTEYFFYLIQMKTNTRYKKNLMKMVQVCVFVVIDLLYET